MTTPYQVSETTWDASKKDLIRIRTEVFINEQLVPPDLEWDGYDKDCWQVIARMNNGECVATARMLYDGHIGRMAVLPAYRYQGIGSALLQALLKIARRQGLQEVFLHAQLKAVDFYKKHGFRVDSGEFMDAGIPHVTMKKQITNQ